jgi:hypothetical protein
MRSIHSPVVRGPHEVIEVSTRYPRIREVYAGDALVRALDRVDALAHSDSLIHLVLVQYLDVLESALSDENENTSQPGSLLHRALEGVHEALAAFGLIEIPSAQQLN